MDCRLAGRQVQLAAVRSSHSRVQVVTRAIAVGQKLPEGKFK